MIELNDKNFQAFLQQNKICVVEFGATWCKPCIGTKDNLVAIENKFPNAVFAFVDVDKNLQTTRKHKIISLPQVLIFKDSEEIKRCIGYWSAEKLTEILNNCPGVEDIKSNG